MKAQKNLSAIIFVLVTSLLLLCCGRATGAVDGQEEVLQTDEDVQDIQKELEGFIGEDAYEDHFEKPQVENNIYIDQTGYDGTDIKTVYFTADNLEPEFAVYQADDDREVFSGKMREVEKDPLTGKRVYRGDFSEVKKPGNYYIQTAVIGRSYTFPVEEKHYEKLKKMLSQRLLSATQTGEVFFLREGKGGPSCGLMDLFRLCVSHRLGNGQSDEELQKKISDYAAWLLQNREALAGEKKTLSAREQYLLAAALAGASQICALSDDVLSRECLKTAQESYEQAQKRDRQETNTARCLAAAALYQATGNASYHNIVTDTFHSRQSMIDKRAQSGFAVVADDGELSGEEMFWAELVYLMTERKVDTEVCDDMMKDFMEGCADYLNNSAGGAYGLTRDLTQSEDFHLQILTDAEKLAVADYTIVGREYRNACRQQIHYVLNDRSPEELTEDEAVAMWFVLRLITR